MNEKNKKTEMQFDSNYGECTYKLVVEQYKLYMEMLDRSTRRRMDTNTLFISINALMVTITSLFNKGNTLAMCLVCLTGYLFSCIWYVLLCNYNIVNRAKWDVINELEHHLPCNPFETEYPIMKAQNPLPTVPEKKGKISELIRELPKLLFCFFRDEKEYRAISKIERYLPGVFACIYLIIFVVTLVNASSGSANLTTAVAEVNEAVAGVNAALAGIANAGIGG